MLFRTSPKLLTLFALVAGLWVISTGVGSGSARAGGKAEFVLKIGTVAPDDTPWANHLRAIKKRVESESGGRIKIKLFLGGVLGGEVEMVRSLRRGRIQGWGGSTAAVAEGAGIEQFMIMELPFLFESFGEADYVLDEVIHEEFTQILAAKGYTFGLWHENGWRNFATKKHAVRTIENLQKLKMRSQESPVHLAMYRALGTQAESIAVPEVLGALQTGMVDGFDNTPLFSSATGWYEGIQHYTISQHIYQPAVILYSKRFIDKLPEDLRKIVIGDWRKETAYGRQAVRAMREDLLQIFRDAKIQVVEMDPAERQKFRDRTRAVHAEFEPRVGQALLQKVYDGQKAFRAKQKAGTAP